MFLFMVNFFQGCIWPELGDNWGPAEGCQEVAGGRWDLRSPSGPCRGRPAVRPHPRPWTRHPVGGGWPDAGPGSGDRHSQGHLRLNEGRHRGKAMQPVRRYVFLGYEVHAGLFIIALSNSRGSWSRGKGRPLSQFLKPLKEVDAYAFCKHTIKDCKRYSCRCPGTIAILGLWNLFACQNPLSPLVTLKYIALQKEAVRSMWDSDWLPNISGKQALYKGLAQYHQSKVAAEQKEIGEEIARWVPENSTQFEPYSFPLNTLQTENNPQNPFDRLLSLSLP